jgi:hypothetical protein
MKSKIFFIATLVGIVSNYAFANEAKLVCISKTSKLTCEHVRYSNYYGYSNSHNIVTCKASVFGLNSEGKHVVETEIDQDRYYPPFNVSNMKEQILAFNAELALKNKMRKKVSADKDELGQCSDI